MRYHIMKKDDIYLRRAMWESYKKKCVYCGIFIEPREMEIDHIFPTKDVEINKSTDKDLQKYIEELKEDTFEINSIENYIITCGDCNRKNSIMRLKHQILDSIMILRTDTFKIY